MTDTATTAAASGSSVAVATKASNQDAWKYRRRFMLAITAFCMVAILLPLFYGNPDLGKMIVVMAFGTLTSIFGFYVAGAVWDDHSIRDFQSKLLSTAKTPPQ